MGLQPIPYSPPKIFGGLRLELVELLAQGERTVEALARAAGMGVSTVSAHLQVLKLELGTVYATTGRGAFVRSVDGQPPRPVPGAPTLTAIDWEPDGPLVGVAPDGTVMTSTDAIRWQERGQLDGPAQALDAVDGRWHAATESGVYESGDDGRTWQPLVLHDH